MPEVKKTIEQIVEEIKSGMITPDAVKQIAKEMSEAQVEELKSQLTEANEAVKAQGLKIAELESRSDGKREADIKSIKTGIVTMLKEFVAEKGENALKEAVKSGMTITMQMDTKAAGTMLISSNVSGTSVGRVDVQSDWDMAPFTRTFLRSVIGSTPINAPTTRQTVKYNEDGDAAFTAEGALKPLVDFDIKTVEFTSKEISADTDVSEKALFDIDGLMMEIENEIIRKIDIKEEYGMLFGSTSDEPVGVTTVASAFVLTTIQTTKPSNKDCLVAAAAQLKSLDYNPNFVVINTIDEANLRLGKDDTGRPILESDQPNIMPNMPVVVTNEIPVGYFLMGDSSKMVIRDYKPLEISLGYTGDNFRKGILSIRGIKEIISYAKDQHHNAFVYDQFSVVKSAIEEVQA